MKVSGFSIIRNALKLGYPVVEAVSSILDLCDEFILNVGKSEDDTLQLVRAVASPKLKIIEREWDLSLRNGGELISVETNEALKRCIGDWCFYIQADEVLHERYHPVVRSAMEKYFLDDRVEGLQFGYKHFYGSYEYYQDNYRNWYVKECRVVRRRPDIISWGDGMDFRHADGSKIRVERIDAEIYHYGWVRPPAVMHMKDVSFNTLYHSDDEVQRRIPGVDGTYRDLGNLKRFTGSHPAVMRQRVAASEWTFDPKIGQQPPDWWRHVVIFLQPLTKRLQRWFHVTDSSGR
ncbi:MAG: glycosyltransferase family 2 protein [Ignavibacteriae bacterium]|nr:glycosyltransferase family 2 protein [Ignavibacteriota bacterium]